MILRPPRSTLLPSLSLFRSVRRVGDDTVVDRVDRRARGRAQVGPPVDADRKSTRLNSSLVEIAYAVSCLKEKKKKKERKNTRKSEETHIVRQTHSDNVEHKS